MDDEYLEDGTRKNFFQNFLSIAPLPAVVAGLSPLPTSKLSGQRREPGRCRRSGAARGALRGSVCGKGPQCAAAAARGQRRAGGRCGRGRAGSTPLRTRPGPAPLSYAPHPGPAPLSCAPHPGPLSYAPHPGPAVLRSPASHSALFPHGTGPGTAFSCVPLP